MWHFTFSLDFFFFNFFCKSWKDPKLCVRPHALPPPGNKRYYDCLNLDKCVLLFGIGLYFMEPQ